MSGAHSMSEAEPGLAPRQSHCGLPALDLGALSQAGKQAAWGTEAGGGFASVRACPHDQRREQGGKHTAVARLWGRAESREWKEER